MLILDNTAEVRISSVMDSVKSRIEEIQKDMDASYNELRSLALRLASAACADENEEISLIAPTLRTAFISARDNFNSIKSRKLQMDELRARLSEGEESLSRLQREKNSTERKLRELEVLIGAVAFAQADSPSCDPEVEKALSPFTSYSRSLYEETQRKGPVAFAAKVRLALYQKNQGSVFSQCFSTLRDKNLLFHLSGEKAGEYLETYSSLSSSYSLLCQDVESRKHRLSASQMETSGSDEIRKDYAHFENEMKEAGTSYGLYLFDNGYKWINQNTGEEYLNIVERMLELNNHIESCRSEIDRQKEYSAISDFLSMIDFNNRKISDLREEIRTINEQIARIDDENRSIRRKIANVKERLK